MTSQLEHSCKHEPGWMEKRALDSRCDENDGGVGIQIDSRFPSRQSDGGFEDNRKTLLNRVDARRATRRPMRRFYNWSSTGLPKIPPANTVAFELTIIPENIKGEQILLPSSDLKSARATGPHVMPVAGLVGQNGVDFLL